MMDDPWGSPWAAPDADKDQKLASSPAKSDLAPPPRALLSLSSSPRIPSVLEQSPWTGDDGDADWSVSEPPVHSIWAGGWGSGASSPNRAATPRDEALGRATPITLPASLATPKLSSGFAFRQPSPDPWASAFSSGPPSNDGIATPRLVVQDASPVEARAGALPGDALALVEEPVWDTPEDNVETPHQEPTPEDAASVVAPDTVDGAVEKITPGPNDGDAATGAEPAGHMPDSQSSTPSNENTDHEDERQDSRHTSVDEEPKPRRPVARKVSGKVQELVDKFDGLARAASEEPQIIRARSKSPLSVERKDDSDDAADFGDFEEATETDPTPLETQVPQDASQARNDDGPDAAAAVSSPITDGPYAEPGPISKFGPVDFPVDLTLVTKLFGDLGQPTGAVDGDDEVTDHILQDSFTNISQRKTWYRISRLGSSRRHDAADDESYRRVTWSTSTVHDETIKIVRRWMEEDSIAGRVQLGGRISKTQKNMFGWDSTAEPVALEDVFAKKTTHSRKSSLQPPKASLDNVAGTGAAGNPMHKSLHRPSGSHGSAVASFSWSSSPVSGQPPTFVPAPQAPSTTCIPRNSDVSAAPAQPPSRPPVAPKSDNSAPSLSKVPPSQTQPVAEDDDEEWGEMVSSPVTSQPVVADASAVPNAFANPISTTSGPQTVAAAGNTNSAASVPNDPWGSVDFSIFESPPTHQASTVTPKPAEPIMESSASGLLADLAVVEPSKPSTAAPHRPSQPSRGKPNTDVGGAKPEDDETAQRILDNLPDLSYMLR